ncbi:MAG: response regulator transcription factor [Flavobacteriales bacterium]|nr:response regulator transcription factor [Flavobacteriales bacterium]
MIKAIIIDDEQGARSVIRNLTEKHAQHIKIVAEADGIETGIEVIKQHEPDIVFLDIQMRTGTGFDLLEKIDPINFEVIFITAYNEYALQAFQFSAFGYLLKPVKTNDFSQIVNKLETHLLSLKETVNQRFRILIENYGNEGEIQKLVIANMKGFQIIKIEDINWIQGDGNYTHFFTNKKKIIAAKNIGEYEKLLSEYGFFRIHQSTIVNLRNVEEYHKSGELVIMNNGEQLKVSRDKKKAFLSKFL